MVNRPHAYVLAISSARACLLFGDTAVKNREWMEHFMNLGILWVFSVPLTCFHVVVACFVLVMTDFFKLFISNSFFNEAFILC